MLRPALADYKVFADVRRITTGRHRGTTFRGGLVKYEHLAQDLTLWMKQDQNEDSWFTTIIDLYKLPQDFPGYATVSPSITASHRVAALEAALKSDIENRLPGLPVASRFIPYIQLHEFEALLFSDPTAFREAFPDRIEAIQSLTAIRQTFHNPEDINDGPFTAPSKRILTILPDYQKPVAGVQIAQHIGLDAIRDACPHFNAWITHLQTLPAP